jgi:hypothetical protein
VSFSLTLAIRPPPFSLAMMPVTLSGRPAALRSFWAISAISSGAPRCERYVAHLPKTALIVVDMLNPYAHEDTDALASSVRGQLDQTVALGDEARRREDVLLAYVNDNGDAWAAGREALVEHALNGEYPDLVEPILPDNTVPFWPRADTRSSIRRHLITCCASKRSSE